MQYQLKIQQLVTYSRCRIYRNFVKMLTEDKELRLNGDSLLYYFVVLCSMANYQFSRLPVDGIFYSVLPGEWILPSRELTELFRKKTVKSTIAVLDDLSEKNLLTYSIIHHKQYIKYAITDWSKFNTSLEADVPCQKDLGFFFFPYRLVSEFIGNGKCSEMDIVLDLWLNAVYNDARIPGSDVGPVTYFRNGTRSPLIGYEDLGKRWGVSKSTAGRIIRKLEDNGYIKSVSFQGKYGSAIYLCNYLSTMFNISDVIIDKEEVAMSLNIKMSIPDEVEKVEADEIQEAEAVLAACQNSEFEVEETQISVPKSIACVPKSHIVMMVQKTAKSLSLQGYACCACARAQYFLSPLSQSIDCKRKTIEAELLIRCPDTPQVYRFAKTIDAMNEKEVG